MDNDKLCKDCKWSHGYKSKTREEALLLICVRPNFYCPNDLDALCLCQRSQGWLASLISGTCGEHGRYFKRRGGNAIQD